MRRLGSEHRPLVLRHLQNRPHPIDHLLLGAVALLPGLSAEGVEFAMVCMAERNNQHVGGLQAHARPEGQASGMVEFLAARGAATARAG